MKRYSMKNFRLAVEDSSRDERLQKNLETTFCVSAMKKTMLKNRFSVLMRLACFTRMLENEPVRCKWLPRLLPLKESEIIKESEIMQPCYCVSTNFKCQFLMLYRNSKPVITYRRKTSTACPFTVCGTKKDR